MIAFELRFVLVTRWRSLGSSLRLVFRRPDVVRAAFSGLRYLVIASRIVDKLEGASRSIMSVWGHLWKSL
jgi:hypothetical protein